MIPENVTGPISRHAEGPVWWPAWGGLRWVDAEAGDLLSLGRDGIGRQHLDDEYLAFVRPRAGGGLVAVGARDLYLADRPDGPARAALGLGGDPAVRMNDGGCDPRGRLLAGSMAYDGSSGAGSLLRIGPALDTTTVLSGVSVSNGIGFTAEGTRAYYVDSTTRRIDAFDVDESGGLVQRRVFARIPEGEGLPDGLAVAADGGVWVAVWGGGAVLGFDEDGVLRERIALPVPQVSACTFGGSDPGTGAGTDDLGTLFITTSAQGLPRDHGTEAGSVYAVRPGVQGVPALPFAG
ncbi:sugar lactone lactonase YvrE [Microbacterium resistens]|uniref:Sugar lactone lactonase YvrE n=1 Tax=Microbacterium resistens TaxID=156977 RepID=A0ABU1SBY8_9MICO|nr:SMP-30/gluconolactonase/LRE family protein [Microbacterium resistens]MDR6867101.1 sugar lactone lactonase YvrE [Microbacterium resistens]